MHRSLSLAFMTAVGVIALTSLQPTGSMPALFAAQPVAQPAQRDNGDTRLLAMPAVSADRIAFVYADDLWVADRDGKNARRLTSDIGIETNPVFSPDGQTIAFTAQYDGNLDVYTIPADGRRARRG